MNIGQVSIAVGRVGSPGEAPAPSLPPGADASVGLASDATPASAGGMPEVAGPPEDDVDPLEDPPGGFEPVAAPLEDPLGDPELVAAPLEDPLDEPAVRAEDPDEDPPGPVPDELALPPGAAGVLVDPAGDVLPGELPLLAQPGVASKAKHPTTIKVDDLPNRFDFQGATIRSSACRT